MRNSISDWSLANPIYIGATVTFYTVSAGVKTTTKATLYSGLTGAGTLANPQRLDSEGKFLQAVYIDAPVIAAVTGLTIPDHDTGVIQAVLSAGSLNDVLDSLAAPSGASLIGFNEGTVASSVVQTVTNVAALRAIAPTDGRIIETKWHTNDDDGGDGRYRGVTGAPIGTYVHNNFDVIVPLAGGGSAAWLLTSEIKSASQAGAISGSNNITQFANISSSIVDGSEVYIKAGTYNFDFSGYTTSAVYPCQGIISLSGKKDVRIFANGAKLKITNLDTRTKGGWAILKFDDCEDITIDGLEFDLRGVTGLDVAVVDGLYPIISAIFCTGNNFKDIKLINCKFSSYNPLGACDNSVTALYRYKQIPVFAQGDDTADTAKGFTVENCIFDDINTYKVFLLGVGKSSFINNKFLNICGEYPAIRNLMHASRGCIVSNNHFEGYDQTLDNAGTRQIANELPQFVKVSDGTNKGGGGAVITDNTFSLTGSGGIYIGDISGATVSGNIFHDRRDMSAYNTVKNVIQSCVYLNDEAGGAGSYPAKHVTVTDNAIVGTVTRMFLASNNSVGLNVSDNSLDSAAGYAINLWRARSAICKNNHIYDVSSHVGTQTAVFVNTAAAQIAAGEIIDIAGNKVFGTAGTAFESSSYDATKVVFYDNRVTGGMTDFDAYIQQSARNLNYISFLNNWAKRGTGDNELSFFESDLNCTLTLTFATPGDLSVPGYTARICKLQRINNKVYGTCSLYLSGPMTHTTASGALRLTGLPYTSRNTVNEDSSGSVGAVQGVGGAGFTQLCWIIPANTNYIEFRLNNIAASTTATATTTHAPTATRTLLYFNFEYRAA